MTVMETTTCFGLCWPSSGCLRTLRASYMHARARGVEISTYAYVEISTPRARTCIQLALKFPRQPDDGQHRPKHVVVSITVIKYTSVIKLCLTTYFLLVSHTHNGDDTLPKFKFEFQEIRTVFFWLSRSEQRQFITDVSEQLYGPIFNGQVYSICKIFIMIFQNDEGRLKLWNLRV